MTLTHILWLCYWLVAVVSIPALATMVHQYARYLYASMWHEEANPIISVGIALGLALVWPLGYVAVGTLFLVSKAEREEAERRQREKSIEQARAFLRKQELEAQADFDRMLGPVNPVRRMTSAFPALWKRP